MRTVTNSRRHARMAFGGSGLVVGLGPQTGRFEQFFGADFSDVRLHRGDGVDRACERSEVRALALGDAIAIHRREGDLTGPHGVALLAHELAHVVQQRAGRNPGARAASAAALEAEADLAASAFANARKFVCRLADPAGVPRGWDYTGHYFTTYLVFLNAGLSNREAKDLATCVWLPDQVRELDAATIGVNDWDLPWPIRSPTLTDFGIQKYGNISTYQEAYEALARRRFRNHEQYVRVIHNGLHSFTDTDGPAESNRRAGIFLGLPKTGSLLKLGLALHAFGDTFAHRRSGQSRLYAPGFGHMLAGGAADEPWQQDRRALYLEYVARLGELATAYTGHAPIVEWPNLALALTPITEHRTPARLRRGVTQQQLEEIKNNAIASLMEEYVPENEIGCGRYIAKVAERLLSKTIEVEDRREPERWNEYFTRNSDLIRRSLTPSFRGVSTSNYPPALIAFCEIVQTAHEWTLPKEQLGPYIVEAASSRIEIVSTDDALPLKGRELKKDEVASFKVKIDGRPATYPRFRLFWSPAVGEEIGGLRGVQASSDTYSVRAIDDRDDRVIRVQCEWDDQIAYGAAQIRRPRS